ncbi:MAG: phage tail tape measure protein [Pseudomonadota bacterium]
MSADLKAQLQISADASGVESGVVKAKKSLADLGATAAATGKQASEGIDTIGKSSDTAAVKVDKNTRALVGSIQRTTAALEAGGRGTAGYYEAIAKQRGVDTEALRPYLDQLEAVSIKQRATAQTAAVVAPAIAQVGMSARATAAAMRGVPAQFTDIVTSLQGGQAPITVFLQQGGQLKDMFGGIGPAARALGGYLMGLISPLTLVAAAVAVVGLAYYQGSKEADAFTRAMILSGNAAGTTSSQLSDMARSLGEQAGFTQRQAAAAVAAITQTGAVGQEQLQRFAEVALNVEKATGQSIAKTAEIFTELERAPLAASIKLNEQIHFLTAASYEHIKALTEQGRATDAARAAQGAYADVMATRSKQITENLGAVQISWNAIAKAASKAWDAMLNVGRSQSGSEQLDSLKKQLADREQRGPLNAGTADAFAKGNAALRAQIGLLERLNGEQGKTAKAEGERARNTELLIAFEKDGDEFKTKAAKRDEAIRKATIEGQALIAAGLLKQADLNSRIADIKKKYEDKGAVSTAKRLDKSQLGLDIETIKAASDQLLNTYTNAEKIVESVRAAGLLSDSEYYASKLAFLNLESDAKKSALQQEIARLEQEKLTGADALDNAKKIADAKAKLAIVGADATAKQEILLNQQEAAAKRLGLAYLSARQAAQEYYDGLERQQNRDLAGIGQGNRTRNLNAGLNQIDDRYTSQRRELENQKAQLELEGKFTVDAKAQYEQRLGIIAEFQTRSLASYTEYYARLVESQSNWSLGAGEALRNYFDESQNVFAMAEKAVTNAFRGMEDALVQFVTTGKLSVTGLVNSIIADLARIAVQKYITGPLSQGLLGVLEGVFGSGPEALLAGASGFGDYNSTAALAGARAEGGPVQRGRPYLVGELGREVFVPSESGRVVANDELGGNITIVQNLTLGDVASMEQVRGELRASEARIVHAVRRRETYS